MITKTFRLKALETILGLETLPLGGDDDILNMNLLNDGINRSLEEQIQNALKNYPNSTNFGNYAIRWRGWSIPIMFREFCKFFNIPEVNKNKFQLNDSFSNFSKIASGFNELLSCYQGSSFGEGVYRIHKYNEIEKWNKIVLEAFPEYKDRIECFGYDWLGRQFALDKSRLADEDAQILMFEPGTGEVLEIPCSFMQFHNEEIPNYHDACLASEFFNYWMIINKPKLDQQECAGYKVLLFLGSTDTVENLEKSDMEVYWSICAQLINKTKDLPVGTKIKEIEISN